MKKKWLIILFVLIIGIGGGVYFYTTRLNTNKMTSIEQDWLEKNKNEVIDISFVNNVPVFNENGTGVLFSLTEQIKKDLGLELNPLPYNIGEDIPDGLGIILTKEKEKNDLTIYQDHYVIITNQKTKYHDVKDIDLTNIGVATTDLKDANYYLKANGNITLKEFQSYDKLIEEMKKSNSSVDGIILPELLYMQQIVTNENFNIAYHISDMTQNLVLRFGDDDKLNPILKKYVKNWQEKNYQEDFSENFTNTYFAYKEISETEKTEFTSKKNYVYGLVETAPFNAIKTKKLIGSNEKIMKEISDLTSSEITWKSYKNIESLIEDFNNDKIDIYFDNTSIQKYNIEMAKTENYIPLDIVVLTKNDNSLSVQSLASLKGNKVGVVKNSKLASLLDTYDISLKTYGRLKQLIDSKMDILVMDKASFMSFKSNKLKNYKVVYEEKFKEDGYPFVLNNKDENKVFNEYFNFYLNFIDLKNYVVEENYDLFYTNPMVKIGPYIAIVVLIILILILVFKSMKKVKKEKKDLGISKEDKLRYIDALTSLKNRNYLNKAMSEWDDNEIYPQAVIVVDLNNIAYINDNYGHEEGDKVIIQAANILIQNQVENTEIIRTSGNEFLVYLIGYEEKQIIMYTRKLNKDFRELAHGFGVAIGYSMILDGIKTLDDAINEATIEMKNNKEESQNH